MFARNLQLLKNNLRIILGRFVPFFKSHEFKEIAISGGGRTGTKDYLHMAKIFTGREALP